MMEQKFEEYWQRHNQQLLTRAPRHLAEERAKSVKMNTAGDWLLLLFPVVVIFWLQELHLVASELLNLLLSLVVGVVMLVLCQMAKPYVTGKRSVADIDADIKQHFYEEYRRTGKLEP